MMKKILLLIILLIPFSVSAMSMELSCDKYTVYVGENVNCSVKVKDTNVSGGEANISVSNGNITSYSKVTCGNGEVGKDNFSCTDILTPNSLTLASYTIKAGGAGTMSITLSDITIVGNNFDEDHPSNIVKNISVIDRPTTTTTTYRHTQAPVTKTTTTQAPVTNEITTGTVVTETITVDSMTVQTTTSTTVKTTVPTVSPKTEESNEKSPMFFVKLIGSSVGLMVLSYFLIVVLKH